MSRICYPQTRKIEDSLKGRKCRLLKHKGTGKSPGNLNSFTCYLQSEPTSKLDDYGKKVSITVGSAGAISDPLKPVVM